MESDSNKENERYFSKKSKNNQFKYHPNCFKLKINLKKFFEVNNKSQVGKKLRLSANRHF